MQSQKKKHLNTTIYHGIIWRYKMIYHDKNTNRLRQGRRQNCRDIQVNEQSKYEAGGNKENGTIL